MEALYLYGPIGAGVLALLYAFVKASWVGKQDPGNQRMQNIGKWIADGAMAFLASEYKVLAIFVITVAAAEAAIGLGLIIALVRLKDTVTLDEADEMRG